MKEPPCVPDKEGDVGRYITPIIKSTKIIPTKTIVSPWTTVGYDSYHGELSVEKKIPMVRHALESNNSKNGSG